MEFFNLMEEGKIKRFFQVRNKVAFEGAIYHITQRAPGREPLFIEKADYLYMLHLIKENVKKFDYELFCFALMPNHLHLLIRLNKTNLALAMKNLFGAYALYFNKKYERKGPVFCKPYRAALCLDENYILAASVYIHLNPVKAGLVQNPSDYRWSSYLLYGGDETINTFLNYDFVLNILHSDIKKAKVMYRDLASEAKKEKAKDVLENPKALDEYKNTIFRLIRHKLPKERIKTIAAKDTLDSANLEEKINETDFRKRLRKPQEIKARKFLIQQMLSRGYKHGEIAKKLNISRTTLYNILNFTL